MFKNTNRVSNRKVLEWLEHLQKNDVEPVLLDLLGYVERNLRRNCAACGKSFVRSDSKQRYCPAPPGKVHSVCGARVRWAEYKSKRDMWRQVAQSVMQEQDGES